MITLYGSPNTRSLRAAWALEEAGAEYRCIRIELLKGQGRAPEFLGINPGGKVPALVDGDLVLTESGAICTYVGERFPKSGLVPPAGTRDRALYDKWCFFVIGELEQPLWTIAKHKFALPGERRVPQVIETATWEFHQATRVLDTDFGEREYAVGDRFTAADILIGHTLAWAKAYKVPVEQHRLHAYADRVLRRPALARARQREEEAHPFAG